LSLPGYTADTTRPITLAQGLDLLKRVRLDRAPGTSYEYSNANFDLLGMVIERVAHVPYATYLQRHIVSPLLLLQTGYDHDHPDPRLHAIGYSAWGVPAPYIDASWLYAAGALYSTVGDLWHWDQALSSDALLSPTSTADMFAAHTPMCRGAATCAGYD